MLEFPDIIEKIIVYDGYYKSIKKNRNKIVEILAKSKNEICLNLDLKIHLSLKKFKVLVL